MINTHNTHNNTITNMVSEEDFKKEADAHQKKVNEYEIKKKQDFDSMSKKNLELTRNFMIKIDKVVIDYARNKKTIVV